MHLLVNDEAQCFRTLTRFACDSGAVRKTWFLSAKFRLIPLNLINFVYLSHTSSQYSPRESGLQQLEAQAKQAQRGLWSESNAVAPWEFRRR